jgi:hypothetical protein
LRVKPSVGEAGGVRLELDVEISSLAPSLAGSVEAVGPTLRQRRLSSTIHLNDDEFAVVGFAREAVVEQSVTGTPWLKDIRPRLGLQVEHGHQHHHASGDRRPGAQINAAEEQVAARSASASPSEAGEQPSRACPHHRCHELGAARRSRRRPGRAQAIADRLATSARPARVSRWESGVGPVFDVTCSVARTSRGQSNRAGMREDG